MLTEKELAEVTAFLDDTHTYSPPPSDPAWKAMVKMADWLRESVAHIEELHGGGTFKLLREAQRRIEEQDKRINELTQCIRIVESQREAARSDIKELMLRLTEAGKEPCDLCAINKDCDRCNPTWRGPVADGEG